MALDSATLKCLEQMAEGDSKPLHECTSDEVRALGAKFADLAGPGPIMEHVSDTDLERRLRV